MISRLLNGSSANTSIEASQKKKKRPETALAVLSVSKATRNLEKTEAQSKPQQKVRSKMGSPGAARIGIKEIRRLGGAGNARGGPRQY